MPHLCPRLQRNRDGNPSLTRNDLSDEEKVLAYYVLSTTHSIYSSSQRNEVHPTKKGVRSQEPEYGGVLNASRRESGSPDTERLLLLTPDSGLRTPDS